MSIFNAESINKINFASESFFREIILTNLFTILDTSGTFQKSKNNNIIISNVDYVIQNIDSYKKTTGIMIYNAYFLNNYSYFLIIFDYHIIIIEENDYPKFQSFFEKIRDETLFFYLNSKKKEVSDKKSTKINRADLFQKIIKKISKCIIKKSQIRTINRHYELSPVIEKTKPNFNIHNFIHISTFSGNNVIKLYFNYIDQYLNILKIFDSKDKELLHRFYHEVSFYENHNGKNPFICKFYGQIQTKNDIQKMQILMKEYII